MIIDTHVHLNDERYKDDLDRIIEEAKSSNVMQMICIGYDQKSSLEAIRIASKYPNVYAAIGIHPSEVKKLYEENWEWLREHLNHPKVVAIGEIGLDYYWDKDNKEQQTYYFKKQLEIAKEFKLPAVIHNREAMNDTFECLKDSGVKGVMHCYSGSLEMAKRFMQIGYYLGIGGVVTFKNSNLNEVVSQISLEHLLSETDAPYLTPEPFRGKTNYPKNTEIIVKYIAQIKGLESIDVEKILMKNTYKLFPKMKEVKL